MYGLDVDRVNDICHGILSRRRNLSQINYSLSFPTLQLPFRPYYYYTCRMLLFQSTFRFTDRSAHWVKAAKNQTTIHQKCFKIFIGVHKLPHNKFRLKKMCNRLPLSNTYQTQYSEPQNQSCGHTRPVWLLYGAKANIQFKHDALIR